jgi:hypothetical protein
MNGKVLPISGDFFSYTRREPVGVVGQIIPVDGVIRRINTDLLLFFLVEFSNDFTQLENWSICSIWLYNSY